MHFMLGEYDALPFGLLRQGRAEGPSGAEESPKFVHCCPAPGQKVMPLDKVRYLLRAVAGRCLGTNESFIITHLPQLIVARWTGSVQSAC